MVALVLNRPFNFSEMTYQHLKENVAAAGNKKFLMFPRFLQMIFNVQLPDLPKEPSDILRQAHMTDDTLSRLLAYRQRAVPPPNKRLIGHLINPSYQPPKNRKKWRNDGSDSDVEHILVPESDDDDDDVDEAVTTTATTATATAYNPSSPVDVQINVEDLIGSGADYDSEATHDDTSALIPRKRRREASGEAGSSHAAHQADFIADLASDDILQALEKEAEETPKKTKRIKHMARRRREFVHVTQPTTTVATAPSTMPTTTVVVTQTTSIPAQQQQTTPIFTTSTTGPSIPVITPSQVADLQSQLASLNSMIIRLFNKSEDQQTQIQQLIKSNEEKDLQMALERDSHSYELAQV